MSIENSIIENLVSEELIERFLNKTAGVSADKQKAIDFIVTEARKRNGLQKV